MRPSVASILSLLLLPLSTASSSSSSSSPPVHSEYDEHLHLRPLPQSALLASFNFRSATSFSAFEAQNYRFFPRSLGQILQHAGTRELHLRFGLGRWDAENWGARPRDGRREGGTGVELWAWLDGETDEDADKRWRTLTNALSGLFCASLNFIDGTRTTRPVMSFRPEGDHPHVNATSMRLLHGVLPREVVCTENLTPFLKLLPCKGKAGISSLLDGHKLFDASWQSMAIDVRPVCREGGECVLEIEQTIDMVLDVERSKRPRDNPIPRPPPGSDLKCDTTRPYHSPSVCFPIDHLLPQEWSLSQIFGKAMKGTCLSEPKATPVCITVPSTRSVYTSGGAAEVKDSAGNMTCFRLHPENEFQLYLPSPEDDAGGIVEPETPLLYAERSFMGYGQEHGAVQAILTNPSPDSEVEFVYMESLPWFMRVYLHTLEARIANVASPVSRTAAASRIPIIQEMHYRPAIDRARGTQLELRMRVPPASTVFLTYDFEKSILRYTEYPPDANRGFDVASAVITTVSPRSGLSLRTTSLLLSLPTPDFSMPYNVIIFTSTAIALAFGGLYNIIVRRFVGADEGPVAFRNLKLRDSVLALIARLKKGAKSMGKGETVSAARPGYVSGTGSEAIAQINAVSTGSI